MSIINIKNQHQSIEGFYKISVIDKNDNIVWEQENFEKNLILNQGMDLVYSNTYQALMTYAVAGTGTRYNKIDPGGSTVSQSGNMIGLKPGGVLLSFTQSIGGYVNSALHSGDVIKLTDGTEINVLNVGDLSASVSGSATIASQSFTIWKTSQVGLDTERSRSNTYFTQNNGCGTIVNHNTVTLQRTYDFNYEPAGVTYYELGTALNSSGNSNVFSRILLSTPVFIDAAQKLRMIYQLMISAYPSSSTPRPNVQINGWPVSPATNTNGSESVEAMRVQYINTDGGGAGIGTEAYPALEPSSQGGLCEFFVSTNHSPLTNPLITGASPIDRHPSSGQAASSKAGYTAGNYYVDKSATFDISTGNYDNIGCMGFGAANSIAAYDSNIAYAFVFEQTQSKTSVQSLTLVYRTTWGRVLA